MCKPVWESTARPGVIQGNIVSVHSRYKQLMGACADELPEYDNVWPGLENQLGFINPMVSLMYPSFRIPSTRGISEVRPATFYSVHDWECAVDVAIFVAATPRFVRDVVSGVRTRELLNMMDAIIALALTSVGWLRTWTAETVDTQSTVFNTTSPDCEDMAASTVAAYYSVLHVKPKYTLYQTLADRMRMTIQTIHMANGYVKQSEAQPIGHAFVVVNADTNPVIWETTTPFLPYVPCRTRRSSPGDDIRYGPYLCSPRPTPEGHTGVPKTPADTLYQSVAILYDQASTTLLVLDDTVGVRPRDIAKAKRHRVTNKKFPFEFNPYPDKTHRVFSTEKRPRVTTKCICPTGPGSIARTPSLSGVGFPTRVGDVYLHAFINQGDRF